MLLSAFCTGVTFAQNADSLGVDKQQDVLQKYRRSSLCSVLITHPTYPYAAEIQEAFLQMPMPDKFNDHNVEPRTFESSMAKMKQNGDKKHDTNMADAQQFIESTAMPRRMVAKWFNRNQNTGCFDMSLIQERGYYDASQLDIAMARETARKLASLGDAGEALVTHTFLIVNDITFVDKGVESAKAAAGLQIAGAVAGAFFGSAFEDLGKAAAAATNEIDGFKVNVTTYLYRLRWNEEIAGTFYQNYWMDSSVIDPDRANSWYSCNLFNLDYVGQSKASAENLTSKSYSKYTKGQQMLKVCARAVDKSIVELQREYQEFRVNVPIYLVNGNYAQVQIGLKEGVSEKSVYEILQPEEDETGFVTYKRIGTLKPVKGKIWDNRFGALEEAQALEESGEKVKDSEAEGADAFLDATYFDILSGADAIMPGCLVREVEIK